MKCTRNWLLLLVLLLALGSASVSLAQSDGNLLANGSFEELSSRGLPVSWKTDGYIMTEGYTQFEVSNDAKQGSRSAAVRNLGLNDARFSQMVSVEPNTCYRLSGFVKACGVEESGWGANLSIEGVYINYEGFYQTSDDWVYTEIYGQTGPEQTTLTVYARLGGYSGESEGLALFDDLRLEKVAQVPANARFDKWYTEPVTVLSPVEDEQDAETKPIYPWLIVLSLVYCAGIFLLAPYLRSDDHDLRQHSLGAPLLLGLGLALAFVLRYLIALRVDGYQVDVSCFRAWAGSMYSYGPAQFYQNTSFCDYPPAYMLVLGLNEVFGRMLAAICGGVLPDALRMEIIIKLIPMACDLAIAWLVYDVACKFGNMQRKQASLLGLAMAFNPALILTSAAWCQVDAVVALLLGLVAWFAIRRKWMLAFPLYVLAVLTKPQALMIGPLGLFVILMQFVNVDEQGKPHLRLPDDWKRMLIGAGVALGVGVVILLPFVIGQGGIGWLFANYAQSLSSYSYATLNTANLHYLFGGNWTANTVPAPLGVTLLLALLAALWGALTCYIARKGSRRLWWLEGAMMGCFAAAYLTAALLQASWGMVGYIAMAMSFAMVMALFVRSGRLDTLPMLGGFLFLLLYVLGVKMHERYLLPAIVLLALACAIRLDRRLLALLAVISCTVFVNAGIVLDNSIRLGSSMGHLNNDTQWLNRALSVINLLMVPYALSIAAALCYGQETCRCRRIAALKERIAIKNDSGRATISTFKTDPSLHWKLRDTIIMLALTVAYAVLALTNLGSTKAPQTTWRSTNPQENVVIDLGRHYDQVSMLYYCRVSYNDFSVAVSDDMTSWSQEYWAEMSEGQCYRWEYLKPSTVDANGKRTYNGSNRLTDVQRLSGRYVRITAQQFNLALNEVIFRDANGNRIDASVVGRYEESAASGLLSDPLLLLDEQDSLEGEPSWFNSTYFDEIYHARTAMELLEGTYPYENTHPPLGKLMMSVFIAIFGMTPFGWRFAGCLMGILMLPAMYLLGKQLTKRSSMATVAMTLMALDCMHFTQTRIATIDSFPVFFIILTFLFMVRFIQRDIVTEPLKKLLPDLALSGFFMGVGIASKWIVMYAGVGLAVLYFWICIRHLRLAAQARKLLGSKAQLDAHTRAEYTMRVKRTKKRVLVLCLWCVLFFIVIPLIVYVLSFVPAFAYAQPLSFGEFMDNVIRMQYDPETNGGMYGYHSTPGLGMDHPFYSPWYEWPVMRRPMYYAMAQYMPAGYSQSIFCFGNPVIWFTGILAFAVVAAVLLKRHLYREEGSPSMVHMQATTWDIAPAMVLIGLLAELIPWMIVPRGTYIYHYFASIPFLILCIMLMLHWLTLRFPKTGRVITAVYLVLALVFFIILFPYASGIPTKVETLESIRNHLRFLNVYYSL